MRKPEMLRAYAEQNRRDQISYSTLASVLSIVLVLFCFVMDCFVYPHHKWFFLQLRICSAILVALAWMLFLTPFGRRHFQVFGIMWYVIPAIFILWMIYEANDPTSPYYAGLNIVLLAVGLLSPWNWLQNLVSAIVILLMYVAVCLLMQTPLAVGALINNTTFLILTATIVVAGSSANARQRWREFELRWELDQSRQATEQAHQRLLELDQAKSRFFANISHELRTPLTLLIAPLETLLTRFKHAFDHDTRELLLTMQGNAMRLLKLINDLLDLVRLESGRMQVKREPVALAEFVAGLMSAARQVAEDKKLRLAATVGQTVGTVCLDRDKLEKTILNLVFNAIKFTPSGGSVNVRVDREGEQIVLVVQDTGVGISAANLQHVFSRFWQADDSARRKFQGVGIGLALVKELAEIQGGSVAVASQEGQGTTFTVKLPYLSEGEAPAAPSDPRPVAPSTDGTVSSEEWLANLYRRAELFPALSALRSASADASAATSGARLKALVADDEPDMRRFIRSQLARDYQVTEACNGQEAVEKAGELQPDIILIDMMMPEKDGLEACRELRAEAATQNVPIIMLTARADEETKLAALSAGASDFLPKPFSTTELAVRVRNLVESHEYQQKLARQNKLLETTIEQLKATESQLVQSEKMASLGRMSAGIIHEINNPLNFATTGLFTLRNKAKQLTPEQRCEYAEILTDVEEGLKRVKDIVSDLRTFAYQGRGGREQVEVNDVVSKALRLLSHELHEGIRIEQRLPSNQTVWADENHLVHVLVNLLQNSLDAMKRKPHPTEPPCIALEGRVQGDKSLLIVRDNGEGIAPEHLDKVFDPFFTTKKVGEGMGLGLSICYRLVQEYEGTIAVRSEPGQFCEFTLEFPVKGRP